MDISTFDVKQYDEILNRGLSKGIGSRKGSMCIEAAICAVLGLDHGDDPGCVANAVRSFKINLNDKIWSSNKARAAGLRDLGLAQLGSLGVVDNQEFAKKLAEKLIRVLIPDLLRSKYPNIVEIMQAADRCEKEGTSAASYLARDVLKNKAADAAAADAADAADAAAASAAAYAAAAAAAAAYAAAASAAADDKYLIMAATLALEVLRELNSPGVALLK